MAAKKAAKQAPAVEVESDAPGQADAAHRRNRDQFNRGVAVAAVDAQNDNEFDGKPDTRLDNRLRHLQEAIDRDDPFVADDWADDLYQLLADEYPEVALPAKPRPPAPGRRRHDGQLQLHRGRRHAGPGFGRRPGHAGLRRQQ